MGDILQVKDLRKRYGQLEAVKGIDFSVEAGEVFALIGPNGAGKTTTLRMVATILQPTSGAITLDGVDVVKEPAKARERLSYLPEEAGAYKSMKGNDYLKFMAEVFFERQADQAESVKAAREISGLGDRLDDKLGTYSKGMTRKLLLARSIMTRPKLAILDEPTSGLDVLGALDIRDTVKEFTRQGMAVLLSSHNMLEIEYLSDRVAIINKGVIHATGTPAELKARYSAQNLEEVFAEVAR
ncbi:MAG: ABC transporter ATP-binding protein [Actinobacteria bacterium]|nr:MAG: ABC transporter ATP-binding protein [Actinomycetota bacterium]